MYVSFTLKPKRSGHTPVLRTTVNIKCTRWLTRQRRNTCQPRIRINKWDSHDDDDIRNERIKLIHRVRGKSGINKYMFSTPVRSVSCWLTRHSHPQPHQDAATPRESEFLLRIGKCDHICKLFANSNSSFNIRVNSLRII